MNEFREYGKINFKGMGCGLHIYVWVCVCVCNPSPGSHTYICKPQPIPLKFILPSPVWTAFVSYSPIFNLNPFG